MPANFVLLLAIGLALVSSSAGAQAPCDAAALNGRYVFTGRGFIEAVQPGIQRMHYGVFVFDGAGKLANNHQAAVVRSGARSWRALTLSMLTAPAR
jgi:hypothetical protein